MFSCLISTVEGQFSTSSVMQLSEFAAWQLKSFRLQNNRWRPHSISSTDSTVVAETCPCGPFNVPVIPVLFLMSVVVSFSMSLHWRTSKRTSSADFTSYLAPLLCTENASYSAPTPLRNLEHYHLSADLDRVSLCIANVDDTLKLSAYADGLFEPTVFG